ncbi:MAG: hypothetical protein WDA00_01965 [Eubacteriales bacterium]
MVQILKRGGELSGSSPLGAWPVSHLTSYGLSNPNSLPLNSISRNPAKVKSFFQTKAKKMYIEIPKAKPVLNFAAEVALGKDEILENQKTA